MKSIKNIVCARRGQNYSRTELNAFIRLFPHHLPLAKRIARTIVKRGKVNGWNQNNVTITQKASEASDYIAEFSHEIRKTKELSFKYIFSFFILPS